MKRSELEAKFVADMLRAFPDTRDYVIEELKEYVKNLSPGGMKKLYEGIKREHCQSRIGAIGVVYKYAKEFGVRQHGQEQAFFYCVDCGIKFSLKSRGCPLCGKPLYEMNYRTGTADGSERNQIVNLQQDCWNCKLYDAASDRCTGPSCGGYGKGNQGGAQCENCVCKNCCQEKYLMENRWEVYQEMDEAGKLEQRDKIIA